MTLENKDEMGSDMTEKQFNQKCCEILDFLHVHGDSTRKQISKAVKLSQRTSDEFLDNLVDAELAKQVGVTMYFRAVR